MKKFVSLFGLVVLMICFGCTNAFSITESVSVPKGTVVPIAYAIKVSSRDVKQDEQIPVYVAKDVYVNDKLLNEPYLSEGLDTEGEMEVTVPKGKLFVLGDNREVSLDSRYDKVGLVDVSDVEGKVFVRLYPFNDISFIN